MSLSPSPTSPNQVQHPHRPGSARAAFAYPEFRRMWFASFASSIGTWMQNVVLPKYVLDRTGSTAAVGLIVFAQLGPLLFLSIPAGVVADRFDRRRWLIAMQVVQLAFSAALAPLASSHAEMWARIAEIFFMLSFLGMGILGPTIVILAVLAKQYRHFGDARGQQSLHNRHMPRPIGLIAQSDRRAASSH